MGTASLVFGLILIVAGALFAAELFFEFGNPANDPMILLFGFLVFAVPMMVGGGLLLRKYDRDRKKEKIEK